MEMTKEDKIQFINENIDVVPRLRMKKFQALDLDKQVEQVQNYIERKKWQQEWEENNKVFNRVKDLFDKRHGTVEDAKEVIRIMQDFIETTKQREIEKIDAEIAKLQEMKKTLED